MKQKLLILFCLFAVLASVAFFYFNTYFVPVHLRHIISDRVSVYLDRRVTIGEIKYRNLQGFTLQNLTIYQKENPQAPLFHVDEVKLDIPLAAILKSQRIIVPAITIRHPYVHLIRTGHRQWNISDLLEKRKSLTQKSSKGPFSLFLGSIDIQDSRLIVTDLTTDPASTELFDETNCRVHLSLKEGIHFELRTNVPGQSAYIKTKGNYAPLTGRLSSQIAIQNFNLSKYLSLVYENKKFALNNGFIEKARITLTQQKDKLKAKGDAIVRTDMDINVGIDKTVQGHFTLNNLAVTKRGRQLGITTSLATQDAVVFVQHDKVIRGELTTSDLKLAILLGKEIHLKGNLNLAQGDIQVGPNKTRGDFMARNVGLSYIGDDVDIKGDLTVPNVHFQFGEDRYLRGGLTAQGVSYRKREQSTRMSAQRVDLSNADLKVSTALTLQGEVKATKSGFHRQQKKLDVTGNVQLKEADIAIQENKFFKGNVTAEEAAVAVWDEDKKVSVKGEFDFDAITYRWAGNRELTGSPQGTLSLKYIPANENRFDFLGTAHFQNAALTGVPRVETITNAAGTLNFGTDSLQSDSLNLRTQETAINLAGTVTDLDNPLLDIKAASDEVDIKKLHDFFASSLAPFGFSPTGEAAVHLTYQGRLSTPQEAEINATANIRDATFAGKWPPHPITDLSGLLKYGDNLVQWSNLQGTYQGIPYTLDGELNNFSRPILETKVVAPELEFFTRVKILRQAFTIAQLTGTYGTSPFDIKGEVHLKENSGPNLDMKGHIDLNLSDLTVLQLPGTEKIKLLKPKGTLAVDTLFRGRLKDWQHAVIVMTATSPQVSLRQYKFDNVTAKIEQGDRDYSHFNLSAFTYNGKLTMAGVADPTKITTPFKLKVQAEDVNLAKLKKDSVWKKKEISGFLALNTTLLGRLKQLNNIQGEGAIIIKEGYLGRLNLLKGIWSVLLIPEFEGIIFTEAQADFVVKDQQVLTDNLFLTSAPLDLIGDGSVDFDQDINFNIKAKFKKSAIIRSDSIKKTVTAILAQAEDYIGVKIFGTLQDPKFEKTIQPAVVIEKATGAVWDGVQNIFEDLFEQLP